MAQQLSTLIQNNIAIDIGAIIGTVPILRGGTGATTAAGVLASLGAYAATNPNGYTNNTGTLTSMAALTLGTTGTDVGSTVATGSTTPIVTLNIPTASAANRGALSAANWTTFNGKQAALGFTPENVANKGAANGYAPLDATSKISSTYLPSYVDDVLEYANLAALPVTGTAGLIYVTVDTNKTYRWSGSAYVEISASPGSTDAVTEGSTNKYYTDTRARASISATQNITYNSTTGVITGPVLSGYAPLASPTFTGTTTIQGLTLGLGANAISTNTALGVGVLASGSLSGTNNVAIGHNALTANTTAIANTAVGQQALKITTTGDSNTALGAYTLLSNIVGYANTAVGAASLQNNTGLFNTAIGYSAGSALTTGGSNTIIGSVPGTAGLSDTVIIAAGTNERMRIGSSGNVGIGGLPVTGFSVASLKNITGATNSYGFALSATVSSDVTTAAYGFNSYLVTQAAAFNLGSLVHFNASGDIGAGSSITNQYGYLAPSGLTGAAYNYGFYGAIAAGTNRYNLYMAGTADNYLAGNLGINEAPGVWKLNVVSTNSATARFYQATAGQATDIYFNNIGSANNFLVSRRSNGESWLYNSGADPLVFYTNAAERMRIDSSGNVGIGATPITGYKVVLGSSTNTARILQNQTAIQADASAYVVGGIDLNDVIRDSIGSYPAAYMRYINKSTNGSFPTAIRGIDITFGTADGANGQGTTAIERMRITASGDVAIGISAIAPASKLHIRQDQDGTTRQIIQNRNATGTPLTELTFLTGGLDFSDNRYAYIQSGGTSSNYISFGTGNGTTPTEKMRISATGLVTITNGAVIQGLTVGRGANAVAGNTAVGEGALNSASLSGSNNIAIGSFSLFSNTIGGNNTAVGKQALSGNTTGYQNVAVGEGAIASNLVNGYNTALGNVALNLSTGSNNLGLGYGAGSALTTGSNNTIIGSVTGTAGLSDTVIIAAGSAERMRINSLGDVGIGSSPSVWSSVYRTLALGNGSSYLTAWGSSNGDGGADCYGQLALAQNFTGGQYAGTGAASYYLQSGGRHIWASAASGTAGNAPNWTERMRIDSSGNVGIGTTSPGAKLGVSGTAIISHGLQVQSSSYGYKIFTGGAALKYYVASFPINDAGNLSSIHIKGVFGGWDATNKRNVDIIAGNRGGLAVQFREGVSTSAHGFEFYTEADSTISVWLYLDAWQSAGFDISNVMQATTFLNPPAGTPTGTLAYTTQTTTPNLKINGQIESTVTGYKFPDGTVQASAATGAPTLVIVTATTQTAASGNHYVLTNAAASTLTLPASPVAGNLIYVTSGNGLATNVIAYNGNKIMGLSENLTINTTAYTTMQLRYLNATIGWALI